MNIDEEDGKIREEDERDLSISASKNILNQ